MCFTLETLAIEANFSLSTSLGGSGLALTSILLLPRGGREALDEEEMERSSPPPKALWFVIRSESPDQLKLLSRLHSSIQGQSTPLLPLDRFPDSS